MKPNLFNITWIGIILLILGVVSWIIEQVFYNKIDEKGILQESFFLPLSFILGIVGIYLMTIGILKGFGNRRGAG